MRHFWNYVIILMVMMAKNSIAASVVDLFTYDQQQQQQQLDLSNEIEPMNNTMNQNQNHLQYVQMERPISWLKNAQTMFASPAGHVVVQVAKELLHRSAGNSQVLSLNLTNLLIIILLKVLIFSAGLLGAGHWTGYGHGYGRSSDGSLGVGIIDGDDYLITGFLAARGAGVDECLYAAACGSPSAAYEYAKAGRALISAVEMFDGPPVEKARYMDLILLMEKAAYDGYRGISCNTTQTCDGML